MCRRYNLIVGSNPFLKKVGPNGSSICKNKCCPTRQVFATWARNHKDLINVKLGAKVQMIKHTHYKYLVNLEVGHGMSVGRDAPCICLRMCTRVVMRVIIKRMSRCSYLVSQGKLLSTPLTLEPH